MKSVAFFAGQAALGRGIELIAANGPVARPMAELNPGLSSSIPRGFVQLDGGRVLFEAIDAAAGLELWVTDGTDRGTFRLRDIRPGPGSAGIDDLVIVAPGRAMFTADDGRGTGRSLWITDGTAAGTRKVSDASPSVAIDLRPEKLIPMGDGRVLFTSSLSGSGEELWVSDGTARGTRQIVDLVPGLGGGAPHSIQPMGDGRFVFSAFVDGSGEELFVTDGRMVTPLGDLWPGMIGSDPRSMTPIGDGLMLFTADDGVTRREPWVTDGTPEGTRPLGNLNPYDSPLVFNEGDAQIDGFTVLRDGLAVFVAWLRRGNETGRETISRELYVTDGTPEGTRPLAPVAPVWPLEDGYDPRSGIPRNLTVLPDGRLIYEAYDTALSLPGYWISDGTPEGTRPLGFVAANRPLHPVGEDKLVYVASSREFGIEPFVIDLSANTLTLLRDIAPGTDNGNPSDFTPLGDGRLVFSAASRNTGPERANRSVDVEPWVTDGTRAGTFKLADLNPTFVGPSPLPGDGSSNPSLWASLGDGRAVFTIDASPLFPGGVNDRRPVYITDGTVAGTRPLLDVGGDNLTYDAGQFGVPPFVAQFDAPTLSVAPRNADRIEGDEGTTPFTFTLTRDGARLDPAMVGWRVVGTGPNPADAADFAGAGLPSGIVRFAAGVAERVVKVQVRGDATLEPDEGFALRLFNPKGAEIARGQAGGVIRSDDVPIIGTGRGERLRGSDKDDRIEGRGGQDRLFGMGGDDILLGGGGGDFLFGGTGRDRLLGGGRVDRLDGGAGNDVLIGGRGADVFVFGPASGRDVIVDFGRGADRIDLGGRSDVTSFRDLRREIVQRDADAVIRLDARDVIVLRNVEADELRASDFLFG